MVDKPEDANPQLEKIVEFQGVSPEKLKKESNIPYLFVIVAMFLIAVVGSIVIEGIRPDKDNSVLIAIIFGFASNAAPIIMNFMKTISTHNLMNSELSTWKVDALAAAFNQGLQRGQLLANERTDKLAIVDIAAQNTPSNV